MGNASIVRVNPSNGPQVFDQFLIDLWRVGDVPMRPIQWSASNWTGLTIPSEVESEYQVGPSPGVSGSTVVQYYNGTFGANLNLFTNPVQPNQSLATITIEYNWSPGTRVFPWTLEGEYLELSILYQVPSARREGVAIYSSWSIGLLHAASQKFVWFETALFDLDRPLGGDVVWLDTISGNVIIHSVLSNSPSQFHIVQPDSAFSVSSPYTGLQFFHFLITDDNIHAAMLAANAKFVGLNLSTVAAEWELVHTNVEVEGTGEGQCGHSLRHMTIRQTFG